MRLFGLTLLSFLITFSTFAYIGDIGMSAKRGANEDYRDAAKRYFKNNPGNKATYTYSDEITAFEDRMMYEDFMIAKDYSDNEQPDWNSHQLMMDKFYYVRDTRMLDWIIPETWELPNSGEEFPRRITWMYPDDGCYARAEMMVNSLQESIAPLTMMKIFVFGNLYVETDNSPNGFVQWWYHVAPTILNNGEYWVFDPAIDPHNPLKLNDWLRTMTDDIESLDLSLCSTHTFTPNNDCYKPHVYQEEHIERHMGRLLNAEYWRLQQLVTRDVFGELGDNPPWLQ